jgi:hypothetical protein
MFVGIGYATQLLQARKAWEAAAALLRDADNLVTKQFAQAQLKLAAENWRWLDALQQAHFAPDVLQEKGDVCSAAMTAVSMSAGGQRPFATLNHHEVGFFRDPEQHLLRVSCCSCCARCPHHLT